MNNHYSTLGVARTATQTDIKKAYRKLAMQYHPDKNQGNDMAHAMFVTINEAYSVLSDNYSRKRYDDEVWLSGMHKTYNRQAITPEWLLEVSRKLNESLSKMDTYRISHGALSEYILLILTNAHLGVLQQHADKEINEGIAANIIQATEWLDADYLPTVIARLYVLIPDGDMHETIAKYAHARRVKAIQQQYFPYIVIIITLALCLFMYFYGA